MQRFRVFVYCAKKRRILTLDMSVQYKSKKNNEEMYK